MKTLKPMAVVLLCVAAAAAVAQEPAWNASAIKERDRACLLGVMDGYLDALFKNEPKAVPPLSIDLRITENTGQWTSAKVCCGDRRPSPRASR